MYRFQTGYRASKAPALVLSICGCLAGHAASAIDFNNTVEVHIPAQKLSSALLEFGRQTGVQVMTASGTVGDLRSPGVAGKLSVKDALRRLLEGTNLQYQDAGENSVAVAPADSTLRSGDVRWTTASLSVNDTRSSSSDAISSGDAADERNDADAAASRVENTEEVVVRGVRFYQPNVGRSASKTDLPLLETPLSVSIVTSEQIEARGADSLEQAFRYSAGVFSAGGGGNRRGTTGFVMRGFNTANEGTASLYMNGSRFPINGNSGGMEPYLYESVELLKGPASVLYGQASPGGLINMVSKLPTRQALRAIKVQTGSWNNRQVNADFGGPLTEDGTWGYRLTGVVRDSDTMIDNIPDDRTAGAAALSWMPTTQTKLTLLASYLATETAYDSGKPLEGAVLPNPNGRIARELFVGEPGFDKFNPSGRTLGYLFEHRFNDTWQVRQNLLWFRYGADFASVGIYNRINAANPRLIDRYVYARNDIDNGWSVDSQVLGQWNSRRFEHTVLFGMDYSEHDFSREQSFTGFTPLDAFSPVYGAPVTLPAPATSISNSRQLGLYFQDSIKFDQHWVAMLGGRWDEVRSEDRSISAGGVASPSSNATADEFTKRIGLLYLSDRGWAPYLSYSESFQPAEGTDFAGAFFKPTAGVQYEAGIKFEPKSNNASLTLAAYQLTRQNVLTADLAHPGFSTQTGEVRARGIEVEGRIAFGDDLDLLASYGSTDAEITKSNGPDLGQTPVSVPENTASLWLDYHYRVGVRGELSLGAGVRYVGESAAPALATVPSYTDYDLSARYDLEQWRFAFNVKNLLDKAYISSCVYACYYGDERNVTFSAQYSW
jgi:iron complex outermembrane receptor protein